MIKKFTNRLSLILGALMLILLGAVLFTPIKAEASLASESKPYEFGETYKGYNKRTYRLVLKEKSNVFISITIGPNGRDYTRLYDENGNLVLVNGDYTESYNQTKSMYTFTAVKVLNAGTYYQEIDPWTENSNNIWSFFATAEPAVKLAKPQITELTNPSGLKFSVKYKAVKYRTGYQIQYATNSKFSKAKKTSTGATSKAIGGLSKGKTYYVRVRAYTLYGTGNLQYGPWSDAKKIKITQ